MPNYRGIDGFTSKTGIAMSAFHDINPTNGIAIAAQMSKFHNTAIDKQKSDRFRSDRTVRAVVSDVRGTLVGNRQREF
jgi:hypothetical protein